MQPHETADPIAYARSAVNFFGDAERVIKVMPGMGLDKLFTQAVIAEVNNIIQGDTK